MGTMHGKDSKVYDYWGNILFEGEFIEGVMGKGYGRQFNSKNVKVWEGGMYAGQKNGNNCCIWGVAGNLKFIVDMENGVQNGYGKEFGTMGELLFCGEFARGNKTRKPSRVYHVGSGKLKQQVAIMDKYKKIKLKVTYDATGVLTEITDKI